MFFAAGSGRSVTPQRSSTIDTKEVKSQTSKESFEVKGRSVLNEDEVIAVTRHMKRVGHSSIDKAQYLLYVA